MVSVEGALRTALFAARRPHEPTGRDGTRHGVVGGIALRIASAPCVQICARAFSWNHATPSLVRPLAISGSLFSEPRPIVSLAM